MEVRVRWELGEEGVAGWEGMIDDDGGTVVIEEERG